MLDFKNMKQGTKLVYQGAVVEFVGVHENKGIAVAGENENAQVLNAFLFDIAQSYLDRPIDVYRDKACFVVLVPSLLTAVVTGPLHCRSCKENNEYAETDGGADGLFICTWCSTWGKR